MKLMHKMFSGLLLALILVSLLAGTVVAQPATLWTKTYGGANDDYAYSLVRTVDGEFALGGFTKSFGSSSDFWLVRADGSGNLLWNRTFGGLHLETGRCLVQTFDSGFALVGCIEYVNGAQPDVWLVKTDASGSAKWNKTYGGINSEYAYSVVQSADGGYAIAGYTTSFGSGLRDFWLIKTDPTGNQMWTKTYGGTNSDEALSVIQTNEGGFVLAGYTTSSGSQNAWLVRTDSFGNQIWNKTYGGAGSEQAYSVIQTADGGFMLAGYTTSSGAGSEDAWIIKTDSNGNVAWSKTYGGANKDAAYSVIQIDDGGYAFAGTNSLNAWLVRTDNIGNVYWNKTYGGSGSDEAFSLVRTFDRGFAFAGVTSSLGTGLRDALLVRSDLDVIPELPSILGLVFIAGFSAVTVAVIRKQKRKLP